MGTQEGWGNTAGERSRGKGLWKQLHRVHAGLTSNGPLPRTSCVAVGQLLRLSVSCTSQQCPPRRLLWQLPEQVRARHPPWRTWLHQEAASEQCPGPRLPGPRPSPDLMSWAGHSAPYLSQDVPQGPEGGRRYLLVPLMRSSKAGHGASLEGPARFRERPRPEPSQQEATSPSLIRPAASSSRWTGNT